MDKYKLKSFNSEHTASNEISIDCNKIWTILHKVQHTRKGYVLILKYEGRKTTVKYDYPTSEAYVDKMLGTLMLDTRTLICSKTKCIRHQFHSHQQMTYYNYNKIQKFKNENYLQNINQIVDIVREVKIKQPRKHFLIRNIINRSNRKRFLQTTTRNENCPYCHDPKIRGLKHTHFLKSSETTVNQETKKFKINQNWS